MTKPRHVDGQRFVRTYRVAVAPLGRGGLLFNGRPEDHFMRRVDARGAGAFAHDLGAFADELAAALGRRTGRFEFCAQPTANYGSVLEVSLARVEVGGWPLRARRSASERSSS